MKLKDLFWDYNFTEDELLDLLHGRNESINGFSRERVLKRMFKYMNWFDIQKFINKNFYLEHITPNFINGLKEKDLKQGLTFVREFLLR